VFPACRRAALLALLVGQLAGCRRSAEHPAAPPPPPRPAPPGSPVARSFNAQPFSRRPMPAEMTELGRALFFDPRLSAFGKMSCATCHDPRFAYGPPNDRATQLGGP